jgi:hypothetical protein
MTTEQTYWVNTNGERHVATGDELKEILDAIAESQTRIKADEIARAEKAAAKAALLERLGITADEATLLLS